MLQPKGKIGVKRLAIDLRKHDLYAILSLLNFGGDSMKKFIALALAMLCLALPAMAEEVDLSGMDLAALLSLHEQLDAAIQDQVECLMDENNIFQGVYVVGKDIKSGYYLVTCIIDSEDDGDFDFFYELYDSEETYSPHNRSMFDRFNCGSSTQLRLQDGMVLRIVNGTALIQPTDEPAWAP